MSSSEAGPDRPKLSDALRERTAALHTQAERSGIINDILRKKADRKSYALLLRNLLPAYAEMERALERQRAKPALGLFAQPDLRRAPRIAADLAALSGPGWERELTLLPEGRRYAARIAEAGEGDGIRLTAHAYVRYFGDLSGGQVLKRLLGQSLGLGPEALTFYEFPGIADLGAVKDAMREALDREGEVADGEAIIQEGMRAFEHNIEISRAIQQLANSPA